MAKTVIRDAQFKENRARSVYTSNVNLTATIPDDDTIPQNTEGTEILSVSITPQSTTSTVKITFAGFGATSSNLVEIVSALFRDTVANALCAATHSCGDGGTLSAGNQIVQTSLVYEFVPGSTNAITFKLRVGATGGTLRMNGISTARRFGGVAQCSLLVEEIM